MVCMGRYWESVGCESNAPTRYLTYDDLEGQFQGHRHLLVRFPYYCNWIGLGQTMRGSAGGTQALGRPPAELSSLAVNNDITVLNNLRVVQPIWMNFLLFSSSGLGLPSCQTMFGNSVTFKAKIKVIGFGRNFYGL